MPTINTGDTAYVLVSSALVLLMTPALAFFYGGLVRRKNVLNTMMSSYATIGIASVLWMLIGYSISFGPDVAHGLFGNLSLFGMNGVSVDAPEGGGIAPTTFAIFQMMFAVITPALITGSIAERMKFPALMAFIVLWSIIVYYPLAHMVWSPDGLLFKAGDLDFAGGNVVHISSGVSALVLALMLGRRRGHGVVKMTPHNVPFVLLGAGLLWFGWFGFNSGSALAANGLGVQAFMTTNTAAAAALVSWMIIDTITVGKPTAVGAATGIVVGLVAITPAAGFVPVWAALIIGLLVSPICWFFVSKVKGKFGYDDALDVFGCHGIGGIWGGIATGLFASKAVNAGGNNGLFFGNPAQLLTQLEGIGITIVLAVAATFVITKAIDLIGHVRVAPREEADGLDGAQHGESAYPSFQGMD